MRSYDQETLRKSSQQCFEMFKDVSDQFIAGRRRSSKVIACSFRNKFHLGLAPGNTGNSLAVPGERIST